MSIENQRIGREGEKRFSLLCTEAGVTCNKSGEDDFGWDMLIEFPPRPQPDLPIDLRATQRCAIVQVKTTAGRGRSCRISLDNALRLAKSPLPAFLFLVMLTKAGPPRYFVIHVWEALIGAWLKAGREADARGGTATHKEQVTVRFELGDEHSLAPLSWIEEQIGAIRPDYSSVKAEIVRSIGFENGHGVADVTIELESPHDFIDMQLGIKESLKASRFRYSSERFGIRAAKPEIDLENVRMVLTPEGKQGTLRLTLPAGRRLAVPCRLYGAVDPAAPAKLWAWRLTTGWFELVFGPEARIKAHATMKVDEVLPLDEIALFVALQATAADLPIGLAFEIDGLEIGLGALTLDARDSVEEWAAAALATEVLRDVCTVAARSTPDMSLAELNRSAGDLEILSALASERTMLIDFRPEPAIPRRFRWLLAYASAAVGNFRYGAVVRRPIIEDVRRGKRRRITFGSAKILCASVGAAGVFDSGALHSDYKRQLDRLAADGDIMALGDLRAMANRGPGDHVLTSDLPD